MNTAYWGEYHHQDMTFGLIATERGLAKLALPYQCHSARASYLQAHPTITIVLDDHKLTPYLHSLDQYFRGESPDWPFELDLAGTEFQLAVWHRIQQIPYGSVTTYRQIAEDIGNPRASRAVGKAAGDNPVPLVIPCHRVVGSNGTMTGFAGGLRLKGFLLNLEGINNITPAGHARFAF
jgi:methylated-DNA-[protein]-cysteine S-methyltransferase